MQNKPFKRYKDGCTIEEIYSLYRFDSELKNIIFYYLLNFEKMLKTSCEHRFSEEYPDEYSYLNISNYSSKEVDLSNVLSNIATLSKIINSEKRKDNTSISHYIKKHGSVPLQTYFPSQLPLLQHQHLTLLALTHQQKHQKSLLTLESNLYQETKNLFPT